MANKQPEDLMSSRYSRQVVLDKIGPLGQEKLAESKVLIIGCGALGTNSANLLVRAGVGVIKIVDRDIIELNNLQRQILFDEEDVGQAKAVTAARKLQKINSEIEIQYLIKDINSRNIEEVIAGFDLVLDATDNIPTRMLINDVCVKHSIPWIYAGVLQTNGMVLTILPDGPCLRCLLPEIPPPGAMQTCETAGILNAIPYIIASIESVEAIKILLKKDIERRLIIYDVWDHRFDLIEIEKSDNCECCVSRDFKYLNEENKEIVAGLCANSVQIIPPADRVIDLRKIAVNLEKSVSNMIATEFILKFRAEGKDFTIFKDGRAIIKGTGDEGVGKALYSRYLGL